MSAKIITINLIVLFLLSGNTYSQNKQQKSVYEMARTIKLKDPKAVMVGYRQPGDDIFEISLDDVGKYTGHVCAGIASAYLLTKQALALLYPNGEIPVRGQISIAASANTDHIEVASYIVRARKNAPESKGKNTVTLIITNTPEGVITVSECDKYKFPKQ